jgi:hypothetical protein
MAGSVGGVGPGTRRRQAGATARGSRVSRVSAEPRRAPARAPPRVDSGRRNTGAKSTKKKKKKKKASTTAPAGPTWQEIRAETLSQDAELSAFLAETQEFARRKEASIDEEAGRVGDRAGLRGGAEAATRQLRGELEVMRSLANAQ